jgi:hypothetical protein
MWTLRRFLVFCSSNICIFCSRHLCSRLVLFFFHNKPSEMVVLIMCNIVIHDLIIYQCKIYIYYLDFILCFSFLRRLSQSAQVISRINFVDTSGPSNITSLSTVGSDFTRHHACHHRPPPSSPLLSYLPPATLLRPDRAASL